MDIMDYYVALNSINAPFDLIFDYLLEGNFFPKELDNLYILNKQVNLEIDLSPLTI